MTPAPIHIVLTSDMAPRRRWRTSSGEPRVVMVRDFAVLEQAAAAMHEFDNYIARIIIDHTGTDSQILRLLNRLPRTFRGEILIATNEWASISFCGEDGRRTRETLSRRDVERYLRGQALTEAPAAAAPAPIRIAA